MDTYKLNKIGSEKDNGNNIMKNFSTKIKKIKLTELESTEKNPQKMDDKTFNGLVQSIKNKGWYFAIPDVWEYEPKKFRIISGHHRVHAAVKAGVVSQNCNVIIDDSYTEEQARKDLLESNERHGAPDKELLEDFVTEILEDYNIDLDVLVEQVGMDDSLLFLEEKEDREVPEVEFTEELLEEHNYVVLYFDNSVDWLQALTLLGLKTVKALHSKKGFECQGVGRVIDGAKAINKMVKYENIG